mgnify:CR=1 FL=1
MHDTDVFCAIDRLRKSFVKFEEKVSKAFHRYKPSEKRRRDFQSIIGDEYARNVMFCSDLQARKKAGRILVKLMSKMFGRSIERAARGKSPTYFALATFIHSEWNCSDRTAAINIQSIRNKVAKAIRDRGLNGIAVIELQALTNYPERGKGKTLMANVHALVWARSPIDFGAWKAAVRKSSAWQADFGCPALDLQPLGPDTLEDRSNMRGVAGYMMKAPHDAKYRKPRTKDPEHFTFKPTQKGYPNNLALRILECLSYLPLLEMVFGVGAEGIQWCYKWRRLIKDWHRNRFLAETSRREVDIDAFWRKHHVHAGSEKFEPFRLLRGSERPKPIWHPDGNFGSTKQSSQRHATHNPSAKRTLLARGRTRKRVGAKILHPARKRPAGRRRPGGS